MTKARQHALKAIEGTELGISYNCVRGRELEHRAKEGTYGSLAILDAAAALLVITKTEKIKTFLKKKDPMALRQAERSLKSVGFCVTLPTIFRKPKHD